MTAQVQRQRVAPTDRQVQVAQELLEKVPALSYDWASLQGQAFLSYLDQLVNKGVPVSWLASTLGFDQGRLYSTMARFRTQRDFRGEA